MPMDGTTLTSVLHQRGVNVRYLGTLLRELDGQMERGRLSHIQVLITTVSNYTMCIVIATCLSLSLVLILTLIRFSLEPHSS